MSTLAAMPPGESEGTEAPGRPEGAVPPRAATKATVQGLGPGPAPRPGLVLVEEDPARASGGHRSVATIDLSGLLATSPDAVRRRLLGPWAEGLRQYLALRLGSIDRAAVAFSELRARVEGAKVEDLVVPPGARARIYRMARAQLPGQRAPATTPPSASDLPFRPPRRAAAGYAEALVRLRTELAAEDAELLELRWARELSTEEMAFVLELELVEVHAGLGRAVARARTLLGEYGERRTDDPIAAAVLDAFALQTPAERSAPANGLEAGTLIGGRYRVVKQVGAGAFGEVYRAEDQDVPGHVVALKLLREPALSSAVREHHLRELKLIAAVFHPSVVHFKDHGWFEERLWFVMPWYEGETLEKRLRRLGGIDRREARRIFEPVARALATLHGNKIRHQDIKPDNIFLARIHGAGSDDGVLPVLLDLGVAATEHEALIGGTPVYFAPEVAAHYALKEDAPDVGPPADVFALALALRNALEPETEEDVPAGAVEAFIEKRSRSVPPPLTRSDLRYLRPTFERWLSLDAAKRPNAEQFAQELAVLTAPEERAERRRRALAVIGPIAAVALSVLGALGYVYVREREISARELSAARDDAMRARDDAARVAADLLVEETRRAAVETDHAALRQQYDEERLTREELGTRLATAEHQITILGDRLTTILTERNDAQRDLEAARAERSRIAAELASRLEDLSRVRAEVEAEGARRGAAEGELADTIEELARARAEARDQVAELEAALVAARLEIAEAARREREAAERVEAAEQARAEAEASRARAEAEREGARGELEEAQRSLAALRRRVEALERAGEGEGASTSPSP